MSQKTLNLCLERYNFIKFGETTKSSHTVLCTNNAYSVNSDKYRLTPTAIASKHGEGYVFTLNYDFDRPLFTIVQKSYALDGTSGNIVFEGIDPISKGGSKYLRKVTVSPVKLSDGSYLLEVTNDEYLRIGTTGAALGDEDLESLNEKIVTDGGITKSVETVGGKQVLKLDAGGPSGAKEIVYFDIDPSDPPSGIYAAITEALSKKKEPVLKIDGAVYFYTATGTDKYVFVGGYMKEAVGYTEIEVSDDDSVISKSVDDKVFNMYMLDSTDPASPGDPPGTEDYWICDENKHVITKAELLAAHADCRYFILNNAIEPDSNSRKYFASVTVISNSYIRLRFYMMQYDAQGVAEFYQKTVLDDSEGRLYIVSSYSATLAGVNQAVLVSEPQNFNSTQKAQGRDNIGAASASDMTALQSQVSSLSDVSAYSVKGEATVAQLNAGPSGIQAGWAYQLTNSGTLTDGSLAVVAGDTVAWDGTKWFPLVNSDYYATKTYAQNVAHSIAPEFYPNETNAVADMPYMYDGKLYVAKEDYNGPWDASKFEQKLVGDGLFKVLTNVGIYSNSVPVSVGHDYTNLISIKASSGDALYVKVSGDATWQMMVRTNNNTDLGYISCGEEKQYVLPENITSLKLYRLSTYVTDGTSVTFEIKSCLSSDVAKNTYSLNEISDIKNVGDNMLPEEVLDIDNYIENVSVNSSSGVVSSGSGYLLKEYFSLPAGTYKSNVNLTDGFIYYVGSNMLPVLFTNNVKITISEPVACKIYATSSAALAGFKLECTEFTTYEKTPDSVSLPILTMGEYFSKKSDASSLVGFSSSDFVNGYIIMRSGVLSNADNYRTIQNLLFKQDYSIDIIAIGTSVENNGVYFYTKSGKYLGGYPFTSAGQTGSPISTIGYGLYKISLRPGMFNEDVLFAISSGSTLTMNLSFINNNELYKVNSTEGGVNGSSLYIVGDLNETLNASLPYRVYKNGVLDPTAKGDPEAKYEFDVPLSAEAFNIRFKFRIDEDMNRAANGNIYYSVDIASCGSIFKIPLSYGGFSQWSESYTYNGQSKTQKFCCIRGGFILNGYSEAYLERVLGGIAFAIKYVGEETTASITCNNDSLVLKKGATTTTYSYEIYDTLSELYEAIKADTDFELDYCEIEGHSSSELAMFGEMSLVNTNYSSVDGGTTPAEEYTDKAFFFVPFAVSTKWHQAEIAKVGDYIYTIVDGIIKKTASPAIGKLSCLTIGGGCKMLVRDLEIDTHSVRDLEIKSFLDVKEVAISSVHPWISIFEGHEMAEMISDELGYSQDQLGCSADRISAVADYARSLGYQPITFEQVCDYYNNGASLPKRGMMMIFDDYQFSNFLKLKNRAPFTRLGLSAYLAVITNSANPTPVTYNGQTITPKEAMAIGKNAGFGFVSHTHGHKHMTAYKPSDYINQVKDDLTDGDLFGIDPNVLVYPYGETNAYLGKVLEFLGLKCAVLVFNGGSSINYGCTNLYRLARIELGNRQSFDRIKKTLM